MILRLLPLALSIIALSTGLLHGQPAPSAGGAPSTGAHADDKMYEDIEIMRHILDRKLHALYPQNVEANRVGVDLVLPNAPANVAIDWGFPVSPNPWAYPTLWNPNLPVNNPYLLYSTVSFNRPHRLQEACHALEVEGVYLKGQGIVYTATVSSLQTSTKAEAPRPPVSEWERVRRELHNEKEASKKPTEEKPTALRDVLLKVLAENGHHFAQLGENESVSFVVTVRGADRSAPAAKSTEGTAKPASKPPAAGAGDSSAASKVRDLELLGDLHMKQEHYGQARDAFREALELKPGRKETATLARKLAQAYLMLSKIEEARAALDQAIALAKEDTESKDKPAAKPAAVALPVKLIISAPKKLLDEAKEGKMTAEEFRRRASVETLTFDGHR